MHRSHVGAKSQTADIRNSLGAVKWLKAFAAFWFPNYQPILLYREIVFVLEYICQTILWGVFEAALHEQSQGDQKITSTKCSKLTTEVCRAHGVQTTSYSPAPICQNELLPRGKLPSISPSLGDCCLLDTQGHSASGNTSLQSCIAPLFQVLAVFPTPALPGLLWLDLLSLCIWWLSPQNATC